MRRFQIPCAALVAGLAVFLSGCAGETPTSPAPGPGAGGGGSCTTVISLTASSVNPVTAAAVRATVTKAGVPVVDVGSVQFSTDLGFFGENGLQTISKTIVDGVADITVFSSSGTAHVTAAFECARAQLNLQFTGAPAVGPFISSVSPTTGSCAGGDTITILGGRFTGTIDVLFGGVSGSIVSSTATQIIVRSPARTLANPLVPETVPLVVSAGGVLSPSVPFTFVGIDPLQRIFITTINPPSGISAGGDTVQINGGHFGVNTATTRVTFCGRPAQITQQADQTITVSTPASPGALEVCDVVVTRDLGLCSQQSATSPQQFTFNLVLTPVIQSSSPKTGPNDSSTRVTIFGSGFQFPMQVFLTGGSCGAQLVEAEVSDITLTTIVFKTPVAVGGNVCLSNQLVDIVIKNPSTGLTANCPACFKYFSCPIITSIAPAFGPYTGGTQVVITGHNFEDPATVGGAGTAWQTISVSSQQIIAVTPPANLTGNGCVDISSPVLVNGTGLNCPNAVGPNFTYQVQSLSPFITGISPTSVPQAGGTPVLIAGGNFIGNMRVVVAGTQQFVSTVSPSQITFTAPAFAGTFPQSACIGAGGVAGTRNLPASVTLAVLNGTTTCLSAIDQLTYIPADQTCRIPPPATLAIAATLPTGTTGTPYNAIISATGGTPGYTFAVVLGALPTGLTLSAGGFISGTPTVAGTFSFSVRVTDSASPTPNTVTAPLSITVSAPVPLAITTTTLPNGALTPTTAYSSTLSATGGVPAYTWTLSGALPTGLNLSPGGVISGTPTVAGPFNFSVTVTDSATPTNSTASANLTITVDP